MLRPWGTESPCGLITLHPGVRARFMDTSRPLPSFLPALLISRRESFLRSPKPRDERELARQPDAAQPASRRRPRPRTPGPTSGFRPHAGHTSCDARVRGYGQHVGGRRLGAAAAAGERLLCVTGTGRRRASPAGASASCRPPASSPPG